MFYKKLENRIKELETELAEILEGRQTHVRRHERIEEKLSKMQIVVGSRDMTDEEYKARYTNMGFMLFGQRPKVDVKVSLVEAVQMIMEHQSIMFDHTASTTTKAGTVIKAQPKLRKPRRKVAKAKK